MLNPGLILERPLKLKEGRTYFIVVNSPDGFKTYVAMYNEYIIEWAISSNKIFEPYWELETRQHSFTTSKITHSNDITPYNIPNAQEYEAQVDHFLGF